MADASVHVVRDLSQVRIASDHKGYLRAYGQTLCSSPRGGYGRPLSRLMHPDPAKATCIACLKKIAAEREGR